MNSSKDKIKFKSDKLTGKIIEVYKTRSNFAKAVSMSRSAVSKRLSNQVNMTMDDIRNWTKALGIPNNEIQKYFFEIM